MKSWTTDEEYFAYYGLDRLGGERSYAYLGEGKSALWTWSVSPPEASRAVVFLHGYLDHSALSYQLFSFLNKRGYRIIAYDLPGHGLSGGERAGLEDFGEYRESLERVMDYWGLQFEETLFVGHSTGGAVILDRLLAGQTMKGVILAAPLIRFRHYDGAVFLLEGLLKGKESVRVSRRPSSSDEEFNRKKRDDFLAVKRMPLDWVEALVAWERSLPEGEIPCDTPLLVLQGEKDRVVSYKKNIHRISRWFPAARVHFYPGLKHHILNEAETDRLYGEIETFLGSVE